MAFDEYAIRTNLNPAGVTFLFAVGVESLGGAAPSSGTLSGLAGFSGYSTAVEACDPISAFNNGSCSSGNAGTVSRSADGNTLTFNGVTLSPGTVTVDGTPYTGDFSYAYAIFTNASSFVDPGGACFSAVGLPGPACLNELTPTGNAGGGGAQVPEPGLVGLLGLGLAGLLAGRRRR